MYKLIGGEWGDKGTYVKPESIKKKKGNRNNLLKVNCKETEINFTKN